MIESFSFSHSGGLPEYCDEVFIGFGSFTIGAIVNGNNDRESCDRVSDAIKKILNSNFERFSFDDISYLVFKHVKRTDEYVLIRITDEEIETEIHGGLKGYIVKEGEIKSLTNGVIKLDNEDRIVLGTDRFFRNLTLEGILADGLTSFSAEEWLDFLVCRISDVNMLSGDNLSALAFIVRKTETIRI